MKHVLTYPHTRNLFVKDSFKPFVKKYFKDARFIGTECGKYDAAIEVSNYEEVKNDLPKYARPAKVETIVSYQKDMTIVEYLGAGSRGIKTRTVDYCKETQNGKETTI